MYYFQNIETMTVLGKKNYMIFTGLNFQDQWLLSKWRNVASGIIVLQITGMVDLQGIMIIDILCNYYRLSYSHSLVLHIFRHDCDKTQLLMLCTVYSSKELNNLLDSKLDNHHSLNNLWHYIPHSVFWIWCYWKLTHICSILIYVFITLW